MAIAMALAPAAGAVAGTVFQTGFEAPGYTIGALSGQNGWAGGVGTESSKSFGGSQAVSFGPIVGAPAEAADSLSLSVSGPEVIVTDEVLVTVLDG